MVNIMTNKNDNSNSKYKNFYVLGDSLSDNGAIIGILNNLSFAKSVKFDDPFYQGGLLVMALLLLNM